MRAHLYARKLGHAQPICAYIDTNPCESNWCTNFNSDLRKPCPEAKHIMLIKSFNLYEPVFVCDYGKTLINDCFGIEKSCPLTEELLVLINLTGALEDKEELTKIVLEWMMEHGKN